MRESFSSEWRPGQRLTAKHVQTTAESLRTFANKNPGAFNNAMFGGTFATESPMPEGKEALTHVFAAEGES